MGNSGIYKSEELFFAVCLVEHDLVGNIQDLEHFVFLLSFPRVERAFFNLVIFFLPLIMSYTAGENLLPQFFGIHFKNGLETKNFSILL